MSDRIDYAKASPEGFKAFGGVYATVQKSGLPKQLVDLVYLRVSQINGCAYCVNSHTNDARKIGETDQRMLLINVWREAGDNFSEEEKLLFEMTEEITLIHQHGLSDRLYEKALQLFGELKTAEIIMVIITVNAWNRIGVGLSMHPKL